MEYIINTGNFYLNIKPKVFEEDVSLPVNTIMEVTVQSDGFSAQAAMDIDIKELARFAVDLNNIYETLAGEARIEEPYGMHMYLSFIGNGRGHIAVKGYLYKNSGIGNGQTLEFENDIDQTYLKKFSSDLFNACKKYIK